MYKRYQSFYSDDIIQHNCVGCDVEKNKEIEDNLLTLEEVNQILNMDVEALRCLVDEGAIRCRRDSQGERRIRAEDVAIFLLEENIGFQMNLNLLLHAKQSKESMQETDDSAQSTTDDTGRQSQVPLSR